MSVVILSGPRVYPVFETNTRKYYTEFYAARSYFMVYWLTELVRRQKASQPDYTQLLNTSTSHWQCILHARCVPVHARSRIHTHTPSVPNPPLACRTIMKCEVAPSFIPFSKFKFDEWCNFVCSSISMTCFSTLAFVDSALSWARLSVFFPARKFISGLSWKYDVFELYFFPAQTSISILHFRTISHSHTSGPEWFERFSKMAFRWLPFATHRFSPIQLNANVQHNEVSPSYLLVENVIFRFW